MARTPGPIARIVPLIARMPAAVASRTCLVTNGHRPKTLKHAIGDFQPVRLGNPPTPTGTPIEPPLDRASTATLDPVDWLSWPEPRCI